MFRNFNSETIYSTTILKLLSSVNSAKGHSTMDKAIACHAGSEVQTCIQPKIFSGPNY